MTRDETGFRMVLRFEVRPGSEDDFERAWQSIAGDVSAYPGNVQQWLARSAEEPSVYYVTSDWVDEATFRQFVKCDFHQAHRERLAPYRIGSSITTMRIRQRLDGEVVAGTGPQRGVAR